jgi:hypothetical protein
MKNLSKLITWPIAAVLIAGGVCFTLIAIYADGATRDALFGANGLVMSIVMALTCMSHTDAGPPSLPPPAALLALVFACSTLPACGASDAMRAAYAEEVARCTLNERAIVAREGTTEEEDAAALELERARCDAALRRVEEGGAQ